MAEQTFRSPGFFEQEIDLSQRQKAPLGTPAGVIGTAEKGPAFVPVSLGSYADFETRFGTLDPDRFGPYAVREYLKFKEAVTYTRVLGAGANTTSTDMSNTVSYGVVKNAGWKVVASDTADTATNTGATKNGAVQFLAAVHYISSSEEGVGFPIFSDNMSFPDLSTRDTTYIAGTENEVFLTRGVIFNTTGSRSFIASFDQSISTSWLLGAETGKCLAQIMTADNTTKATVKPQYQTFKYVVSSSSGQRWGNGDGVPGLRIFTASLNPASSHYIGKSLNTDPDAFQTEEHLLYLDLAVADELAPVSFKDNSVALMSGSGITNAVGLSDSWMNSFGRFDTRYRTARTTSFISQPFGTQEFDLFHVESLSDGIYSNDKLKISISAIVASTDKADQYGSFNLEVRKLDDLDTAKQYIETFPNLSLDPNSDRFIGRQVGDMKVKYDFDAEDPAERRLVISGKYPNKSANIRVVINDNVYRGVVPDVALPFGYRGIPVMKTSDTLTDVSTGIQSFGKQVTTTSTNNLRMGGAFSSADAPAGGLNLMLSGAIIPPLPYRFKVTRGKTKQTSVGFKGAVGENERIDPRLYWGAMTAQIPVSSSYSTSGIATPCLDPNAGSTFNPLVGAYTRFNGIEKLGNLVTGSGKDVFNNNKFTLARVALVNTETNFSTLTGSANEHMIQACYFRKAEVDGSDYRVYDSVSGLNRITFASLINSSSVKFNRFTDFAKFTNIFYGGFDGVNALDKDIRLLRDRAASTDAGGKGGSDFTGGLGLNGTDDASMSGAGSLNNIIFSYRKAVELMTDPMIVNTNLLAIPGIRDPFITDKALRLNREYSMAMFVMDIQHYDEDENRLYDDSDAFSNPRETAEQFDGRGVDNNYGATYYPDVYLNDPINNRAVRVPSSVVAYGALGYNDLVAYPWFAPAGFNRGSLGAVVNTEVRLSTADRDNLYDARINPIANFPQGGFVIFGQKTLQKAKSSLDRVNVRRMLLEVKRLVVQIADKLLFEPNTPATRQRFVGQIAPILALVQSQQGIEKFSVVCDGTNNTTDDVEQNKLNGRIVVVPTRSIEFIAIDFIVTNSGVLFV
ncbi:MAG TPA: hypothetical protein EYF95_07320 [Flavobacteriales bacterium]|jgi:hypothetical protein|nr:hypothetical protein [Flavobacteriales bacterium]